MTWNQAYILVIVSILMVNVIQLVVVESSKQTNSISYWKTSNNTCSISTCWFVVPISAASFFSAVKLLFKEINKSSSEWANVWSHLP